MRKPSVRLALCLLALLVIQLPHSARIKHRPAALPLIERDAFGVPTSGLDKHASTVQRNESLESIMNDRKVPRDKQQVAFQQAEAFIDFRKIGRGDSLYTYTDSSGVAEFVVYKPSIKEFLVFDFGDSVRVHEDSLTSRKVVRRASGTIAKGSSLFQTIQDSGLNQQLALNLSEIFAWQVSFFHLLPGDQFSILYEDEKVHGQSIGTEIKAARFRHADQDYYAFYFPEDGISGFYDEEGRPSERPFLRAPVEFSRISSQYSRRRFHPIQRRYKPHLGTDFAAPRGTPIVATANGTVINATYAGGNGNYVKIRHNDVYTTGYLHMSRIKSGIRPGVRVQQGDVIGYVGSTGLATGPHVCYRFWKNGRQVDAMRVEMPKSEPLPDSILPKFFAVRDGLWKQLPNTPEDQLTPETVTGAGD